MNRCCVETAARVSEDYEKESRKLIDDSTCVMHDLGADNIVYKERISELKTALRLFITWMNEDGTGDVLDKIALKELMGIHNIYKTLLEK